MRAEPSVCLLLDGDRSRARNSSPDGDPLKHAVEFTRTKIADAFKGGSKVPAKRKAH